MAQPHRKVTTGNCPGCGRPELHKFCPAWGTPHYMSGHLFTAEMEAKWARSRATTRKGKTTKPSFKSACGS